MILSIKQGNPNIKERSRNSDGWKRLVADPKSVLFFYCPINRETERWTEQGWRSGGRWTPEPLSLSASKSATLHCWNFKKLAKIPRSDFKAPTLTHLPNIHQRTCWMLHTNTVPGTEIKPPDPAFLELTPWGDTGIFLKFFLITQWVLLHL